MSSKQADLLSCLQTHRNDLKFHHSGMTGITIYCQKHDQAWYLEIQGA